MSYRNNENSNPNPNDALTQRLLGLFKDEDPLPHIVAEAGRLARAIRNVHLSEERVQDMVVSSKLSLESRDAVNAALPALILENRPKPGRGEGSAGAPVTGPDWPTGGSGAAALARGNAKDGKTR